MAKTKVALITNDAGVVDRIRVGDTEIAVAHAGPAVVNGSMGVTLMIADADISVEKASAAAQADALARASRKG
jgi:hypothetical protein